jgi:hypothetical protein
LNPGEWTTAGLWSAVVVSGIYHGINPGMGWPLAVSAALMGKGRRDLVAALIPLAAGHFFAMAAILLPFALLISLVVWQREIRIVAALLVIGFGVYIMVNRRHPRFLARVRPTQLALWSFLVATAHGAGLMLAPVYLGLCGMAGMDGGHQAAATLMSGNLLMALLVSGLHTAAMIVSGGIIAIAVHAWLGLKFLSRSWFNLDLAWAVSLVLVGIVALVSAAK